MFISYYLLKEFLVPACLFREWHLQKLQGPGNTKVLHSIKGLQAEHRLVNQWMVKTWKAENFSGKRENADFEAKNGGGGGVDGWFR